MLDFLRRKPSGALLLTGALLGQLACIFRAFGVLLLQPGQYQLVGQYDGVKNYFTFQSYLQQPFEQGLGMLRQQNYPYGDYLFYTDNTPLFALPVKLFSHYVLDLTPYGLDVYHGLLLTGLLLSTALLVPILRRLGVPALLVLLFSIMLPWLNPQTERLVVGHFNLSLSCVLLFAVWALLHVYDRATAGRPLGRWVAGFVLGMVLAGFAHLYYLPIVGFWTGGFFLAWLLSTRQWGQRRLVLAGGLMTLLPVVLVYATIRGLDGYYGLRLTDPTGFNYAPWKMQFSALFQPAGYNVVHFLIEPTQAVPYESRGYLGAFALFGLVAALVAWLGWRGAWRQWWQSWQPTPTRQFLLLLLLAALVGLFASFGTRYDLADGQFTLYNYLSPFFYLRKLTETAAHFRAFGRFQWPFFWAVNLGVLAGLSYWLRTGTTWARWAVTGLLVVLALLDTRDTLKHFRSAAQPNVLTNTTNQPALTELTATLRPADYQAILPIPYFHVGSEDMDLTVDDDDAQATQSFQLALRTGLPLLASKMSRTPPAHARALRSLFEGSLDGDLHYRLQAAGKPVLVFMDESYYDGSHAIPTTVPTQRSIIDAGPAFVASHGLTPVGRSGKLRLYRWEVK